MDHSALPEVASAGIGHGHPSPQHCGYSFEPAGGEMERGWRDGAAESVAIVREFAVRYHISSIQPLLNSCIDLAGTHDLRIAVFGRFKAGK